MKNPGDGRVPVGMRMSGEVAYARLDKPKHQPWAPPHDETDLMPDASLRCAVTGHVDAADDCTCAGCTAAKVRGR